MHSHCYYSFTATRFRVITEYTDEEISSRAWMAAEVTSTQTRGALFSINRYFTFNILLMSRALHYISMGRSPLGIELTALGFDLTMLSTLSSISAASDAEETTARLSL